MATPVSQAWTSTSEPNRSTGALGRIAQHVTNLRSSDFLECPATRTPRTPQERLDASWTEPARGTRREPKPGAAAAEEQGKTVLYLAYGSNLCNETFRGMRGIRPISQVNVMVPELRLTFDLPGIPYREPCFANSARRDPAEHRCSTGPLSHTNYHKDRWRKGMVGCVYEVTPSDYAHIIATEGGGASYHDILVTCHVLPDSDTVPDSPSTPAFKAHTLFAPAIKDTSTPDLCTTDRFTRPDPSYAQPSARYLKLIADGASELSLPAEYQDYLHQIRPYTITTKRQAIGATLFLSIWGPFVLLFFTITKMFQDDRGRSPKWLVLLGEMIFTSMWLNYDAVWKGSFGDGERTDDDGDDEKNVGM
ncbi:hypothetical protein K491DRAFT_604668 [Lophiostoma macrostomum CBS 122681]|uniref:gamma-glutamylcyclotransferase n=1 Tax=Lophiostoma macrostomum CBS 122681 TaxID=1314788 RepID=A0A6A6T057_9PLEO|nr:hypothetical protein K491DRAFT_604668 [Lophiostoma macrostomum CBS 122681]